MRRVSAAVIGGRGFAERRACGGLNVERRTSQFEVKKCAKADNDFRHKFFDLDCSLKLNVER